MLYSLPFFRTDPKGDTRPLASDQACVRQKSRNLFGAPFGRIFRVSKSVFQSARFSPDIFGDLLMICDASSNASQNVKLKSKRFRFREDEGDTHVARQLFANFS